VPLPTAVSNCQLCDVTVEPFAVTVGVVGFKDPPAHNAAGVDIVAIVGLSLTVKAALLDVTDAHGAVPLTTTL
jgi:hypothetical protein